MGSFHLKSVLFMALQLKVQVFLFLSGAEGHILNKEKGGDKMLVENYWPGDNVSGGRTWRSVFKPLGPVGAAKTAS